ncbi:MAG: hemin uptake protein HemP [Paracoccaceae bacterium]
MQDTPPTASVAQGSPAPVHDALMLTKGGPVAHIALDGQVYVLRITRAGKLILTK